MASCDKLAPDPSYALHRNGCGDCWVGRTYILLVKDGRQWVVEGRLSPDSAWVHARGLRGVRFPSRSAAYDAVTAALAGHPLPGVLKDVSPSATNGGFEMIRRNGEWVVIALTPNARSVMESYFDEVEVEMTGMSRWDIMRGMASLIGDLEDLDAASC